MQRATLRTFVLLSAFGVSGACHKTVEKKEKQMTPEQSERTDVEGLAKLINLPFAPQQVRWQTTAPGQGGNWSLSALLWVTPEEAKKVADSSEPLLGDTGRMLSRHARWLPPSAKRSAPPLSNDDTVVEIVGKPIEPTLFTNAQKSPLMNGDALVIPADGLVFVSLFTM